MYIYSTASADQKINLFAKIEKGQVPRVAGFVLINGKANVANKNLETRKGVITKISDKEWELLQNNPTYKKMEKAGFMTNDSKVLDPETVAKGGMEAKDRAAPLVEKDATEAGVNVSEDSA